jgi:hypothetical protein
MGRLTVLVGLWRRGRLTFKDPGGSEKTWPTGIRVKGMVEGSSIAKT